MGERLKQLRDGLTQAEFAQRLGLSQAQYNRYETGKRLLPDPPQRGGGPALRNHRRTGDLRPSTGAARPYPRRSGRRQIDRSPHPGPTGPRKT
ncbi:hypothetical protein DFAR_2550016 [Desulfarculales bacterium]